MGLPPKGVTIPTLRLDAEGGWWVDGERIEHERSCHVLTENVAQLDIDGERRFVTSVGSETVPIVVDDVGYFAKTIDVIGSDLFVALSDRSEELQSTPELEQRANGRIYVRIKGGAAWARLSRGAFAWVSERLQTRGEQMGIALGERFVLIRHSSF